MCGRLLQVRALPESLHRDSAHGPRYWQQASADLARNDLVLAGLVERFAGTTLVSRGDPFVTLLRSIVGQQISVKAADSVWARFSAALPVLTHAELLARDPDTPVSYTHLDVYKRQRWRRTRSFSLSATRPMSCI